MMIEENRMYSSRKFVGKNFATKILGQIWEKYPLHTQKIRYPYTCATTAYGP